MGVRVLSCSRPHERLEVDNDDEEAILTENFYVFCVVAFSTFVVFLTTNFLDLHFTEADECALHWSWQFLGQGKVAFQTIRHSI